LCWSADPFCCNRQFATLTPLRLRQRTSLQHGLAQQHPFVLMLRCFAGIAGIAYNAALLEEFEMATLTVRDLDDALKASLRVRAARHSRSMEEEVRQILRAALAAPVEPTENFFDQLRSHFVALGDIELPIPPRQAGRAPPTFDDFATPRKSPKSSAKTVKPSASKGRLKSLSKTSGA
jgi:antitoxin FitA